MNKESKFEVAQATPVPARRSPRISSQRDIAITKTISPLVISQAIESRRQTTKHTEPSNTETSVVNNVKAEAKGSVAKQCVQVKELRRSPRVISPKQTDGHPRDETLVGNLLLGTNEKKDHCDSSVHSSAIRKLAVTKTTTEVPKGRTDIAGTSEDNRTKSNKFSPSVPDTSARSIGSVQVRELRKIQDYWTRKSPSTERSPRLRSSSHIKSDCSDELTHKATREKDLVKQNNLKGEASSQISCNMKEIHESSLPESPVPRNISETLNSVETQISGRRVHVSVTQSKDSNSNENDAMDIFVSKSPYDRGHKHKTDLPKQNSNITVIRIQSNEEKLVEITSESPTKKCYTRSASVTCGTALSPAENLHKSPRRATVDASDSLTEIIVKDITESDSDNDDDYIPPRKKLRSEVSTDELWEGFPSFSFKRLAPIRKSGESDRCNTPNTSTDSDDISNDIHQKPETLELITNETEKTIVAFTDHLALTEVQVKDSVDKKTTPKVLSETLENMPDLLSVSRLAANKSYELKLLKAKKLNSLASKLGSESLSVDNQVDSASDAPKKASVRKRKYNDSPNVPLKRSARLQEKQTTSPVKSANFIPNDSKSHDENNDDIQESRSVETEAPNDVNKSEYLNSEEVITEADNSSKVFPCTNENICNEEQSGYTGFTKIQENKRELSILEILSHDFNEHSSSSASKASNNKYSVSDDSNVTSKVVNDSDKNSYSDTSEENKVSCIDIKSLESDNKAAESVSNTLLSLLKANSVYRQESETENISSTQIQSRCKPESPADDFLHNIERDHSITDNLVTHVLDNIVTDSFSPSSDYIPHSSMDDKERHEKTEKIKHLKFSCSTESFEADVKIRENGGTKKDIPPLRIKLKPKSGQLKKKDVKQRKDKAKLPDNIKGNKIKKTSESSDSTADIPAGSVKDKKKKSKKKKQVTDDNQKAEQPQDETTPNTKKSKKPVSKRRKSSPNPSNMELRLNNERRKSVADEMLSNPVIDKHACVLWSSENRRHIVLSKPDASHADIDDILRNKWEKLSDKEKLRYFQRAINAIKDENRHSTRRREEESKAAEPTPSSSVDPNPPLTRFIMMTPGEQLTELKKWLHFYHDVSVEEYDSVLTGFKETLQKEKTEKEKECETENAENKVKTKAKKKAKTKKEQKEDLFDDFHAQARYRKLLFEKIFEVKDKVLKIWKEGKEKQKEKLNENFSGIVKKLITGADVDFSGNVVSGRLTEVLKDIKNLETARKIGVSGKDLQSKSFLNLVKSIKQEIENVHEENPTSLQADTVAHDQEISHPSDGGLPHLNPTSIQEVFNEISDTCSHHVTRPRPSPSLMLTSCVIADLLEDQVVQEEAGRNINNNMSQTAPYAYSNREFKSILNLEDLKRKYATKLQSGAETNVVSSDAYARTAGFRNMESVNTSNQSKVSVPQKKFVNLSNHCIFGSRSGVVALQHYDNGRPVVRYARVKPAAHSAAQLRLLGQRQRMRFTPQVRFNGLASRKVDEATVENKQHGIVSDADKNGEA